MVSFLGKVHSLVLIIIFFTRALLATHLEPTFARQVFPCFDEPNLKATFSVSVIHHEKFSAIGNMPIRESKEIDSNHVETYFQTTPKMSTYTMAFSINDLPHFEISENIRVYAPEEVIKEYGSQFEITAAILKNLEEFTGIRYKLPKIDHVIIHDWSADGRALAMENWGLITYS